jgi:L-aminopeptidase/D-esterase-like protein
MSTAISQPRARDLGVPFSGTPGPLNAISDVAGVEVGHSTIITGDGLSAVRTGVSVVWPRGKASNDPAFAGWFSLNGNGEMTGTTWVEESGFLDGPVFITNTHSVGVVRDAYIAWQVKNKRTSGTNNFGESFFALPVVAETWDGFLNDANGLHVKPEHTEKAIDNASAGQVPEGNVGGGTGMICYGFKGGIGTSSRIAGDYKVGVLIQCNCGRRSQLQIAGVPVGVEIPDDLPATAANHWANQDTGSIIITIATDAPLLPSQLKRLARRASMGLARTGSTSGNGSGDIFIAFSTANPKAAAADGLRMVTMLPNDMMNPIFQGTVEATEEAIVNSMVAARTMTGYNGHRVFALPHDKLKAALRKYNRLSE